MREPTLAQVDHFIPWSRYADDGLDNFDVADVRCNGFKAGSLGRLDSRRPLGSA